MALAGLLVSVSFFKLLESDQNSSGKNKKVAAQQEFKMQLMHSICSIASLFSVFDGNNDGVVEIAEVDALTSYMGTLMADIMSNGIERWKNIPNSEQICFQCGVQCIFWWLDLAEKFLYCSAE